MATAAIQTWSPVQTRKEAWLLRVLPSLTDLAFALPLLLLLLVSPSGVSMLLGDGDTGWHIRTGEWILQHHAVPHQDLFSYTRPGESWFAWEWGWDVAFAAIHQMSGLAGVVFVNVAILGMVSALLFRLVRRACDNDMIAFAITAVAMCASMVHWLARPHLLSWLFFLLALHLLARAEDGRTEALVWLPPLVLIWTNMHGSFFLGLVMIVIAGIGALLQRRSSRPFWLCAIASAVATFANPYTWHVHAHIWSYLVDSKLMDNIQEFQSPNFHRGLAVIFEAILLLGAAAVLWCLQNRRWSAALVLLLWAHLSLVAARNIPLFLFVACPSIAAMLLDFGRRARSAEWFRRSTESFLWVGEQFRPFERVERLHAISALVLVCFAVCSAGNRPGFDAHFPGKQFPEAALGTIRRANPARIFTSDQWGDFFIYEMYPQVKVFVDGRSDFYGGEFIDRCRHILGARWDWKVDLQRFSTDMVVVTPDAPLATVLKISPDWRTLFDNGSVMVFGRRSAAQQPVAAGQQRVQVSAVVRNGGTELEAVSAVKHESNYKRRCL